MKQRNNKRRGFFRRNLPTIILLVLVAGAAGYFWTSKDTALNKQRQAFELEKIEWQMQTRQALETSSRKHLQLMMKTFVWAVRGEVSRNNLEQVDQYFKQMVKVEHIKEITLVDKTGKILVSTNKKNEGLPLQGDYVDAVLKSEELTLVTSADDQGILAAPIMYLDSRLGNLMLVYRPDHSSFSVAATID